MIDLTEQRENATPNIIGLVYQDMATEKKMVQGNEHTVIAPSVLTVRMIMQGKVRTFSQELKKM